ncbi:MAG TPA: decaprenylphospho-beta-D-erythro-pentofuranosid-2-ulose 2-reductase [Candidatus Dormibacteraeota bacterium]|jgi:decaprenylphospho-beta-D-erythro-pentofuranosid-2-ulose 2-reductase|nr:decaprenylphospho-beta-D-erythro-pentofuranosid-2-ulose 2-reductase [Candidatus Dormibacteraeota bacterium]
MKDAFGSVQSVLIFGGASEIALATAKKLAQRRARTIVLAGRDMARLDSAAANLRREGAAHVETAAFDATDTASHQRFVDDVWARHHEFDLVLLAFGVLGDQERDENDAASALHVIDVNFRGAVSVGIPVTQKLRAQGHGSLVVLSTVAAERARRANFVYGASKAGLDAFFQGLADSMVGTGVQVLIVRPGFVHTKMTEGRPAAPFATTPEKVAEDIVRGIARNATTIWSPGVLRPVMSAMRHLPRPVFRKLRA